MQTRHKNRFLYFNELATTSKNYFIPYIQHACPIQTGMNVLEIGCGDGGNLLPFSQMGCRTTGIDISVNRIEDAKAFFQEMKAEGRFIASDIFNWKEPEPTFDLIICHDQISSYLHPNGILFMSFPAWQMPFGGHQQICTNKIVSHLPFIHLLPIPLYRRLLQLFGETERCIRELLEIKQTGTSIEAFEKLIGASPFHIFPYCKPPIMAHQPALRNQVRHLSVQIKSFLFPYSSHKKLSKHQLFLSFETSINNLFTTSP